LDEFRVRNFLDQVALADAADRRVAGHLPQRLEAVRQKQGLAPHPRGRERSLGARMATTDHDDVKISGKLHAGRLGRGRMIRECST
jgi:hypothetical protein